MQEQTKQYDKLLTITVPAYNVEAYLDRCLSSMVLTKQTSSEPQPLISALEVLVINDGSKDGTEAIGLRYQDEYPDTFRVISKENGGHGSGINMGIREARGKYFKVVDGDDWVETEALGNFLDLLGRIDADLIASDYQLIRDGSYEVQEVRKGMRHLPAGRTATFSELTPDDFVKIHAFTIKTELLRRQNERIDEHCFYVDTEYVMFPIPFTKTVYYDGNILYNYRVGRDGQSVNIRSMQKNRAQHEKVLEHLLDFYRSTEKVIKNGEISNHNSVYLAYLARGIALVVENQFQIYLSLGSGWTNFSDMRSFDQMLRKQYPLIFHSVRKRSIWFLRYTGYLTLPIGAAVYRQLKMK